MPELSRSQLLVYGSIAIALLLVGARWVREDGAAPTPEVGVAQAAGAGGETGSPGSFSLNPQGGDVVVHVAGAVENPGVYRMPAGSRVTDAVERAGGASGGAGLDGINLAARVADGQQIVVPGSAKSAAGVAGGTGAAPTSDGPISLGSATVEELDTIEGIGPVTSADIVEYRDQHGGLSSVEELDQIAGIGPVTMEALKQRLQP